MKFKLPLIALFTLLVNFGFAQYALQINGGALITMSGGTSATPIYLIVDQAATTGIDRVTSGHIITEGQYNYVQWNMQATNGAYVVPFGKDGTLSNYAPFTFNKSSGTCNLHVSTRGVGIATNNTPYFNADNGVVIAGMGGIWGGDASNSVIDRWWHINLSSTSGTPTAEMIFTCFGEENTTGGTSTFKPQRWSGTGAGGAWQFPVGSGASVGTTTGTTYTVSSGTGITAFSPWVLSRASTPLPIQLIDFTAVCNGDRATLNWSTATETNNDFFTIERSSDGVNFTTVATMDGAPNGNSTSLRKYQHVDNNNGGIYYYRLKQTDFDGKSETFKMVSVDCATGVSSSIGGGNGNGSGNGNGGNNANNGNMNVYPNPSTNESGVYLSLKGIEVEKDVLVVLVDVLGQVVYSKITYSDASGNVLESLNDNNQLASGVYTVIGSVNDAIYKQKIIVR